MRSTVSQTFARRSAGGGGDLFGLRRDGRTERARRGGRPDGGEGGARENGRGFFAARRTKTGQSRTVRETRYVSARRVNTPDLRESPYVPYGVPGTPRRRALRFFKTRNTIRRETVFRF